VTALRALLPIELLTPPVKDQYHEIAIHLSS
jgi:hypothetical protein